LNHQRAKPFLSSGEECSHDEMLVRAKAETSRILLRVFERVEAQQRSCFRWFRQGNIVNHVTQMPGHCSGPSNSPGLTL
jgi:hypothetical protein